jgi:DNA polymerase-3 subunit epsilon
MARKLCPQQRCSLSALAYRFDTKVKPVHRALHDAQATGELLLLFLSWLEEQGLHSLEEVARFCEPATRRNYHKIALTESIPTGPGVYVMRDGKGAPLYIGKAENLRRRTRDHFLQRQAFHARQALELLERIDVTETGSEFGALLLESRLIARHRPPYNSHGTRAGSYHYVKLSAEEYPRLYATPNLRNDGSYYAGPFRKAALARRFVECVNGAYPLRTCAHLPRDGRGHACQRAGTGMCLSPCRRSLNGEYAAVVEEVGRVLRGHGDALDRRLHERQQAFVKALAFERAAHLQNQRETLDRAMRTVRRLRGAARDHLVLVYPAHRRGWVALWGARGGRIVVEREVGRAAFDGQAAEAFVAALRAAEPPHAPLPAGAVDELLLVHSWVEAHRAAPGVVDLQELVAGGEDVTSAAARLLAAVRLAAAIEAEPATPSASLPAPRHAGRGSRERPAGHPAEMRRP